MNRGRGRAQKSLACVDGRIAKNSSNRGAPVTTTRSGDDAVQLDRLALLDVVPHEHAIRLDADQPAVGQVVPAERREDHRHADAVRALHVVGLVRPVVDERRHQHDVRTLVLDEEIEQPLARDGLLGQRQRACDEPAVPRQPG